SPFRARSSVLPRRGQCGESRTRRPFCGGSSRPSAWRRSPSFGMPCSSHGRHACSSAVSCPLFRSPPWESHCPGASKQRAASADGALTAGMGVVVVDCKGRGSGLLPHCRRFATARDVPLYIVEADDRDTVGYNPCSGDPAAVANKLVGAFSFSADAEIYKQVAL